MKNNSQLPKPTLKPVSERIKAKAEKDIKKQEPCNYLPFDKWFRLFVW